MKSKNLHLLFLSNLVFAYVFAQPTIKTQRVIGGSAHDAFYSMCFTNDGGMLFGGSSNSPVSGNKTDTSRGSLDYWIVKTDSSGHFQWDKTIGGIGSDELRTVLQTDDGGYIVGGYSYSSISGEKTQKKRGLNDYWIVKLNSIGNIEWDKAYGGSDEDRFSVMQQTRDGGYILGGYSPSNISGEKTENSRGNNDYWVVKVDRLGSVQWDKTIGGNDYDALNCLQQTADGGYILGGVSLSNISGEKTENSRGSGDYWIVKLDSSGNIQWDKTIGGNDEDELSSIQLTYDGGYILGGMSFSNISGEKTHHSRGQSDYWIVKLDSLGNIQGDKTIGGDNAEELSSLEPTHDGGWVLGGWSASNISGEKSENGRGNRDYWIVKLNRGGDIEWDKTIGGDNEDDRVKVLQATKNIYIVGGASKSDVAGDKTKMKRGRSDFWIVVLEDSNSIINDITSLQDSHSLKSRENKSIKTFSIYPNPVKDILHIQSKKKIMVSLTNEEGKVLLTKTIEGTSTINVANLRRGLYYLKNTATNEMQKVILLQ